MHDIQTFSLSDCVSDFGLACNRNGLDLAGVPLLHKDRGRFRPRSPDHVAKLLTSAYDFLVDPDQLTGGLQAVAHALNDDDVSRAMIAALWLRLPPLDWNGAVRIAQEYEIIEKYDPDEPRDRHGRWTASGVTISDVLSEPPPIGVRPGRSHPGFPGVDRHNPLFHPAAAEEDDNGRGGLLDNFTDLPREYRQDVYQGLRSRLKDIDPGNSQLETLTSPDYSPSQADVDTLNQALRDAQERAGELPATDWELGWGARGVALELKRLGGIRTLPSNAPTIDDFPHRVAVSIKSIDLNAPWYRNPIALSYKIDRYVDKLAGFDGLRLDEFKIGNGDIEGKVLDIVIPIGSGTSSQMRAINKSKDRAKGLRINLLINRY